MGFNLQHFLKEQKKLINQNLLLILEQCNPTLELTQAIKHSLMAGGKRLRPILALCAAQACGKDTTPALPVACALEMVHTYSLIHDDLPAMDDDDLRRGLPTCHTKFSEATAILAGDALLTHAFHVLSSPETVFKAYPNSEIQIKLIQLLSKAAGLHGMVEGQMLDMQSYSSKNDSDLEHLKKIHELKTGKIILASVECGALSVNAPQEMIVKLKIYAKKIGMAFQIYDDILNVEGDPDVMGKAAGSDELNDKMTFPSIIGLDASKEYATRLVNEAIEAISDFKTITLPLTEIASYIINRDR